MDSFGNVQGVEVEAVGDNTGSEYAGDLLRLKEIVQRREEERKFFDENRVGPGLTEVENK